MYAVSGTIVRGEGYGKKLGFPTVNIYTVTKELPPAGVYSGTAELEGKKYRAGIVAGPGEKIEAHLIGYNGNAYGKTVALELKKFLREFKEFDTEAELIIQIKKDLEQC
jgi:riboflavin kinase/FMN adenylyltransferase